MHTNELPLLLITLGDVAGVGPEVVARAWPDLLPLCRPVVCGDETWMKRGLGLVDSPARVHVVSHPHETPPTANVLPLLQATAVNLEEVRVGRVSAAAGQAAFDFLCRAIDLTLAGQADGIVTCPLN